MANHGDPLWIVELNPQNSWYSYFNYLSRFQISKYMGQLKNHDFMVLHSSQRDFPASHILFVEASAKLDTAKIKEQWEFLGKPKALVFPGFDRWFQQILAIDSHKFYSLDSENFQSEAQNHHG